MTRKVDTYEYESLGECIRSDQVSAEEIAEIFTDKGDYSINGIKKNIGQMIDKIIEKVIDREMDSDNEMVVLLSGGVDSLSVACWILID